MALAIRLGLLLRRPLYAKALLLVFPIHVCSGLRQEGFFRKRIFGCLYRLTLVGIRDAYMYMHMCIYIYIHTHTTNIDRRIGREVDM